MSSNREEETDRPGSAGTLFRTSCRRVGFGLHTICKMKKKSTKAGRQQVIEPNSWNRARSWRHVWRFFEASNGKSTLNQKSPDGLCRASSVVIGDLDPRYIRAHPSVYMTASSTHHREPKAYRWGSPPSSFARWNLLQRSMAWGTRTAVNFLKDVLSYRARCPKGIFFGSSSRSDYISGDSARRRSSLATRHGSSLICLDPIETVLASAQGPRTQR